MGNTKNNNLWSNKHAGAYESENYAHGISGFVLRHLHTLIEKEYSEKFTFDKVLEIGSGSGIHINYIRHRYNQYYMSDLNESMIKLCRSKYSHMNNIHFHIEEAQNLSFGDNAFDRVIASHVLEHIYKPHEALKEWKRVLKPGGVLSLVLPCDPGLLWRIGRNFGPRRNAKKRGLDYDYVMALEHVNGINNLIPIIRHMFKQRHEIWWPLPVPSIDMNLIYCANIIIEK